MFGNMQKEDFSHLIFVPSRFNNRQICAHTTRHATFVMSGTRNEKFIVQPRSKVLFDAFLMQKRVTGKISSSESVEK
jgi:hypothetical protein